MHKLLQIEECHTVRPSVLSMTLRSWRTKIAATILAEAGEIDRSDHAKKLVAFAGVDPSVFSSGKFTATRNTITKRVPGDSERPYTKPYVVVCVALETRSSWPTTRKSVLKAHRLKSP